MLARFICAYCGKLFRSSYAAERASVEGCPHCKRTNTIEEREND